MDEQFIAHLYRDVLGIEISHDLEKLLCAMLEARNASNDTLRSFDTRWTEPILTFDPRW